MKFNFSPIQKTPSSRLTIPSYRSEVPFVCKYGQIFQFDGQIWYNKMISGSNPPDFDAFTFVIDYVEENAFFKIIFIITLNILLPAVLTAERL